MPPQTTALVTGATQGIGRATAFALGRAGYRVGVCARTAAAVEQLVGELRGAGIEAAGRAGDVADPAQVDGVVRHVAEALGEVDVLVNNAGVLRFAPLLEITVEDWDLVFDVNARAMLLTIQAGRMHALGHTFYLSTNGVWLVDAVPAEFIRFP